jgi:hypothetical protein
VDDIRKGGQAWQEIKNKKHMNTEEIQYSCPYKIHVLDENMWIKWRVEQAVINKKCT